MLVAVLALESVWKRYGRSRGWVLRDLDLTVPAGTVTVLLGGNGAGKSTLLRIAAGASFPTRGRVRRPERSVAYLPERLPVDQRLTAEEYLRHMAALRGAASSRVLARSSSLLERLELNPGPRVPIGRLSKGNRQKVHLARVFAAEAELSVLDEPFAGLDEDASVELRALVIEAREGGRSVVLSAHERGTVEVCDRLVELADGTLRALRVETKSGTAVTRLVLRSGPSTLGVAGGQELAVRAGVRSVETVGDLSVVVTTEPDDLLRDALASGWSFVEGGPGETP